MSPQSSSPDEEFEGEAAAAASAQPGTPAPETEFLSDVTQIYLHEIGLNPLLAREEELHHARQWLEQLNYNQRTVIECRFGLNGREVCTLEELARKLELTRERVRQIQLEALGQLRRVLRRRGLSRDAVL